MPTVTIELSMAELDYVMNTLASRPYGEVNGLIAKVLGQVNNKPKPAPEPESEPH